MRCEYKVLSTMGGAKQITEMLNLFGRDGWRLREVSESFVYLELEIHKEVKATPIPSGGMSMSSSGVVQNLLNALYKK